MEKTELIGIRVKPAIKKWLSVYEKALNKNTSEIIRDMLENAFNQYRIQRVIGKRVNKRLEDRMGYYRKRIQEVVGYFSNTENVEKLVQTLMGLEGTLQALDFHFKALGLGGRKGSLKRKRIRQRKGEKIELQAQGVNPT